MNKIGIEYLREQINLFKQGGKIKIKEKNKGKFTKLAKSKHVGVQELAHQIVNDDDATSLQKRRAQFAINSKKWNH